MPSALDLPPGRTGNGISSDIELEANLRARAASLIVGNFLPNGPKIAQAILRSRFARGSRHRVDERGGAGGVAGVPTPLDGFGHDHRGLPAGGAVFGRGQGIVDGGQVVALDDQGPPPKASTRRA